MIKLTLPLVFISSLLIIGCGGGSGNTNSSGAGTGAGTGGCVSYPRYEVGQVVKRQLKDKNDVVSLISESRVISISSTSMTIHEKDSIGGFVDESDEVTKYTIANNFMDITEDSGSIYTPFHRIPIDKVCEDQTWTTTYTETDSDGEITQHSKIYTVEAVNVSKTTLAGTFNTFRIKEEDGAFTGVSWIDIDSGYDVFSDFTDTNYAFTGTLELIEKSF